MAYQYQYRRAQAPLGATSTAEIQNILKTAPKVILTIQPYVNQVAALAPQAVPILRQLQPLLTLGPRLAPLVAVISKDVATILTNAPSYQGTLTAIIDVLARAPALAAQIAGVTGQMAALSQKVGEDPALGPFIDRLQTIIRLYENRKSGSLSGLGATSPGIGLKFLIPWLDRAVFVLEHPWVAYAVPIATALGLIGLGYGLGRATKTS